MKYFIDLDKGPSQGQSPTQLFSVPLQDFFCPSNKVLDSLPLRLTDDPQFKIFRRVIQFVAINMVNILPREQVSPNLLLHNIAMFKDMPTPRNYNAFIAARRKVRPFHLSNASLLLVLKGSNFAMVVHLLIMRHAIALCPQGVIAVRDFASRAVRVLGRPPIQIASLAQSALYVPNFSPTFWGRAQDVDFLAALSHVMFAAKPLSFVGNWARAVVNGALLLGGIFEYAITHGRNHLSFITPWVVSATPGQNHGQFNLFNYSINPPVEQV